MSLTILLAISGCLLLCIATFQFATIGLTSARAATTCRQQRASELRTFRQAAEIARLNSELQSGNPEGLGWRVMEVAEIIQESADCRSFYLIDPYGQPLPDFRPGQYLMVRPAIAGAYQATRCYSLSSSPNPRFWRITVKKQELNPDAPAQSQKNGGLSKWLHGSIGEGDCVLIGGPSGQFYLPKDCEEPLVLMAAGVGITPMASMLRWSLEHTPQRKVVLLYQVRDLEHWPLGQVLHSWQSAYPNIQLHTFGSREPSEELDRIKSEMPGKFTSGKFGYREALEAGAVEASHYFMCGPDPWMTAIREGLIENGVPKSQVHWESFGGTGAQPFATKEAVDAVAVRFEASDVETHWEDPEQTLWELAKAHDVEIPSGCLSGVCGCCRVRLVQGEVEYDRDISIELADDECLTCVTRPKTEVVIDA